MVAEVAGHRVLVSIRQILQTSLRPNGEFSADWLLDQLSNIHLADSLLAGALHQFEGLVPVSANLTTTATYVGQVERDPEGRLWAVLYCRDQIVEREQVRSLRKAKRRVTNMVLAAADTFPDGPQKPARSVLRRVQEDRALPSHAKRRGAAHAA